MADDAYSRDGFDPPKPYEIFRVVESPTGYRGIIYQHPLEKNYVVAHTGTEFDVDKIRDVAFTDAQMALLKVNQQLDDARATVELALEYAKRDGTQVTVTGHSLGGFLTEVTCHEYGLKGETFNGYGAAGLYEVPAGGNQVINHVRATDMVGAANQHFGQTRIYATTRDLGALFADGRPPSQDAAADFIANVARLNPDQTHNAVQFHNGVREPEQLPIYGTTSIITAENQARYQQHKAEFDIYRENIYQAAHMLSAGFRQAGIGATYSAGIGAQHVQHKIRNSVLGSDVLDELHELRQQAREQVEARNRHFTPPGTPMIYPDNSGNPVQQSRKHIDDLLHAPTLEDSQCKPSPGSGWGQSVQEPLSLRDNPLDYINRMIAADDRGDHDTFRQMIREAANDPFARQMQQQASVQVDMEERLLAQQQAEQQRQEQMQRETMVIRGPSLGR